MAQVNLDLTTTKATSGFSWADGQLLTEAKLDRYFLTDIEAWANDAADNINQIRIDGFGSAYTLDNDAATNFPTSEMTLYNPFTATATYSSNIALGVATDVDFVAVDATNARIVFTTAELSGAYTVMFQFTDHVIGTAAVDIDCETSYRITDGTTNSNPIKVQHRLDGTGLAAGDQFEMAIPVSITALFTGLAASTSTTFTLQKRVTTATAIATHDTDGAATNVMYMLVRKT